jgi:hypothetical protein
MKNLFKNRKLLTLLIALATLGSFALSNIAATTAGITVTSTPQFLAITISPSAYNFTGTNGTGSSGAGGQGVVPNNVYYSNPNGDTTAPTGAGALTGECDFTITNTSSVPTNMTVVAANFTAGSDQSTNINTSTGSTTTTPGTTSYEMASYFTGQATAAWIPCWNTTGGTISYSNLAATTNVTFGLIYKDQTNAWTGGTAGQFTVTVYVSAH